MVLQFGNKRLAHFNLALLGKWKWILLFEKEGLGAKVIKARYEDSLDRSLVGEDSHWWNDLGSLEGRETPREGWLSVGVSKRFGNGCHTSFWEDVWVEIENLKSRFNRLYQVSLKKDASVAHMGEWSKCVWC